MPGREGEREREEHERQNRTRARSGKQIRRHQIGQPRKGGRASSRGSGGHRFRRHGAAELKVANTGRFNRLDRGRLRGGR